MEQTYKQANGTEKGFTNPLELIANSATRLPEKEMQKGYGIDGCSCPPCKCLDPIVTMAAVALTAATIFGVVSATSVYQ